MALDMTLDEAKDTLDVKNSTFRLRAKTKKCKTWKDLALMLVAEFSKD